MFLLIPCMECCGESNCLCIPVDRDTLYLMILHVDIISIFAYGIT